MRTTTELTARFNLASTLTGAQEITAFWESVETWEDSTDDDCLFAPAPSYEIIDAMEEEELRYLDGYAGLVDALDFAVVPFEQVEADLAVELYEQDCAEERDIQGEYDACTCARCGREETWDIKLERHGMELRCHHCTPSKADLHRLMATAALVLEQQRRRAERKAKSFRAALDKAKKLRPDLNWAHYEVDHRLKASSWMF